MFLLRRSPRGVAVAWFTHYCNAGPLIVESGHTISQSWRGAPGFHLCRKKVRLCIAQPKCMPLTTSQTSRSKYGSQVWLQALDTGEYWLSECAVHVRRSLHRNQLFLSRMKKACTIYDRVLISYVPRSLSRQYRCISGSRKYFSYFELRGGILILR